MKPANVAMAVLLVGVGVGCARQDRTAEDRDRTAMASPSPTADVADRDQTPSAGDISGNPALYNGKQVTLKTEVKKLLPNGFFVLEDDDLLVLSPAGQPAEGEEVTIHGTVHTYSAPELESRYSWFRSDEAFDREYKDRPVVVADSILTADGRDVVKDRSGASLPAGPGEPRR
jgi:hypothetical protein